MTVRAAAQGHPRHARAAAGRAALVMHPRGRAGGRSEVEQCAPYVWRPPAATARARPQPTATRPRHEPRPPGRHSRLRAPTGRGRRRRPRAGQDRRHPSIAARPVGAEAQRRLPRAAAADLGGRGLGARARAHRRRVGALPRRHRGHRDHQRHHRRQRQRRAEHPARRRRQPRGRPGQPASQGRARRAARRPGHRGPQLRHDHRAARARGRRRRGRVLDPARLLRRHPRLPPRQDQRGVPGGEGDRPSSSSSPTARRTARRSRPRRPPAGAPR